MGQSMADMILQLVARFQWLEPDFNSKQFLCKLSQQEQKILLVCIMILW